MSRVFAQRNKENEWSSIPVFAAVKAFNERGFEIIPYYYQDIETLDITVEDFAVGGVPCVRQILQKFNIDPPTFSIPHDSLLKYCKRKFGVMTIEELNSRIYKNNYEKIFIKPYKEQKRFNGHVISEFKDLFKTMNLHPTEEIVFSEFVDFVTEYRIFVINGKIDGMSFYHGNPLIFPNKEVIESLVKDAYECYLLEGFSVDIGVTSKNETLLIEINDGFSLGSYGLNHMIYSKLIEERWKQLMRTAFVYY